MKKAWVVSIISICIFVLFSFIQKSSKNIPVPYPEGYRSWTHVKSSFLGPQNPLYKFRGGFIHIYANQKALNGLQTGNFTDGSILVFDVIKEINNNGDLSEGERRLVDVMVKDSISYNDTGGWGFEEFNGDSKTDRVILQNSTEKCFNCHSRQKQTGYVFSKYRP
ncbi:MAG TPA: cytochrome P460 family protein [Puia sp.]|nr:cytochrome P460 family protein [Puia sp.]